MKISKRLRVIGDLVQDNSFILDIGCDHALLDIYVVLNKKNVRAIASDINNGPLIGAKDNIKKYELENKIKIKCLDGIDAYEEGVDTLILSGLGSITIVDILKKGKDYLQNIDSIIISSNNNYYYLRYNLCKLGFYIFDEKIILDKGKYYPIIVFKKGKKRYNKHQLRYGPLLLNSKDKIYIEYLTYIKDKLFEIDNSLTIKHFIKKIRLKKEIKFINNYLKKSV